MFNIYGGAAQFNQWELDKMVTNPCMKEGDEVVFRNSHGETYVVKAFVQNGEVLADVPNYLLKTASNILVDLEQGNDRHSDCRTTFAVIAQPKPDGYKCDCNVPDRPAKSGGGVSSWNDLTDKPETLAYIEEGGIVEVLPECQPEYAEEDLMFGIPEPNITLAVGETYVVRWNGTDYPCVAQDGAALGEAGAVVFGNIGTMTGTGDSGEPFVVMVVSGIALIAVPLDGSTTLTLAIYQGGAIAHKLDCRCLPDGVPYIKDDMVTLLAPCPVIYEGGNAQDVNTVTFVVGETYIVTVDGVDYSCVAQDASKLGLSGEDAAGVGDLSAYASLDPNLTGNGEPFVIITNNGSTYVAFHEGNGNGEQITISIKQGKKVVVPLPAACLPDDATEMILVSPNGTKYAVTVSDDGALTATAVT